MRVQWRYINNISKRYIENINYLEMKINDSWETKIQCSGRSDRNANDVRLNVFYKELELQFRMKKIQFCCKRKKHLSGILQRSITRILITIHWIVILFSFIESNENNTWTRYTKTIERIENIVIWFKRVLIGR